MSDSLMRRKLLVVTGVVDSMVFTNPVIAALTKLLPVPVSTSAVCQSETDRTILHLITCVSAILPLVQDDQVDMASFSDTLIEEITRFREVMDAEHDQQNAELSAERTEGGSTPPVSGQDGKRKNVLSKVLTKTGLR